MNIILTNCSKQLSPTDIDKAEVILSISLPNDLKAFYLKYNGGNPDKTLWCDPTGHLAELELREFIPLLYARPEYSPDFTLENLTKKGWAERELPSNFIIFAMDSGENFYCIDYTTQEIYYFVRDVWSDNLTTEQNLKVNSKRIARSFISFLDELSIDEDDLNIDEVESGTNNSGEVYHIKDARDNAKNIEFTDCEKKLSIDEINTVEKQLDVSFSEYFKSLYLEYNGGKPNKAIWIDPRGEYGAMEIRNFIPMLYAEQFGDDPDFTLNGRTLDEWASKALPMNLIQFAIDWDGNYFCLGRTDGKIYYFNRDDWDENLSHDQNLDANTKFLSDSFANFIDELVIDK